jgi:hypothetical protein
VTRLGVLPTLRPDRRDGYAGSLGHVGHLPRKAGVRIAVDVTLPAALSRDEQVPTIRTLVRTCAARDSSTCISRCRPGDRWRTAGALRHGGRGALAPRSGVASVVVQLRPGLPAAVQRWARARRWRVRQPATAFILRLAPDPGRGREHAWTRPTRPPRHLGLVHRHCGPQFTRFRPPGPWPSGIGWSVSRVQACRDRLPARHHG